MDLSFLKNRFADIFFKNKITTVYIKNVKEKRLHILLPSGKEELVNYSALICCEEKSKLIKDLNNIIKILREKNENREKFKDLFNLREIWEVVVGEAEELSVKDAVELILGKEPEEDEIAGFIRKVLEEKLYFKLKKNNVLEVLSKNEVENLLLQKKREIERLKKLNQGEEFVKALQKGEISGFDEEERKFWINALKEFVLWENQTPSAKLVQEVLKRLNMLNQNKVFDLLVKIGTFDEDENLEILKTRYPVCFSEKELKAAKELERLEIPLENRVNLEALQTFTVDSEDTQDFDDALSFEKTENNYILYIHIADVAEFIKPGSILWESALERASTLYLPDGIFPMLPFSLSHEKFSLKENALRPAITFKIVLDKDYNIIEFQPLLSIIKVKKRSTYEEVDRLLIEGDAFWKELYSIMMHFKKKREENGALAVFLPEIQLKVKENKEIILQRLSMTPARQLIAEAMILVNTLTAELLYKNKIPAVYRSQPKPSEIIENFEDNIYLKLLQLKFLAKSELSTQPEYHSGLGLDYYTTLTSPIRRFLDLLIQYQLKCFLSKTKPLSEEEILKVLPELSSNLQRASSIQNKREKYFLLKYLQLYTKDKPLKGLVLSLQNKKGKVYLLDYNIIGDLLSFKQNLTPGQEVIVKIEKVQPRLEILRLKPI